jgi:dihydroorotate dehydrogenase
MNTDIVKSLLFRLPPESAHHLALNALNLAYATGISRFLFGTPPSVPRTVMGLHFPNPIGLAAGFDKNAQCINGLGSLGFGFLEVGTVTPRPQSGNPQPRLFRLPESQAVINRMGFNNLGVDHLLKNVQQQRYSGILGINLGKNATTPLENAVDDYLYGLQRVYPHADYITINISSPNTKNLRQLQQANELQQMLQVLKNAQTTLAETHQKYVPLVLKIAPDLSSEEIVEIAKICLENQMDGIIATNTTLSRIGVESLQHGQETGGLSGAPLTSRATEVVRLLTQTLQHKIPVIASGGVMTVADVQEKFAAGASLVQIYTGLIYQGTGFVRQAIEASAK